jgi:DNA primase
MTKTTTKPKTTPSPIERIKATITVDDMLARYGVALKRAGVRRVGPCPICTTGRTKKSRAFVVSADGRSWYCFGDCGRGGNVVDLVMALEGCSLADALVRLQR